MASSNKDPNREPDSPSPNVGWNFGKALFELWPVAVDGEQPEVQDEEASHVQGGEECEV